MKQITSSFKISKWVAFLFIVFPIILFTFCTRDAGTKAFKKQVVKTEKERVLRLSEIYWNELPITVTSFSCERSAGDKHDFYSEGDYWWPDPENADGPYIRKDGLSNPGNFSEHRHAMIRLNQIVGAMASAYLITGDDKYVEKAVEHLHAWFIEPESRMNPNLLYAQAIKGRYTGRGIGIIDALHLIEVARAIKVMQESPAMTAENELALKSWFGEFLKWISTHEYGKAEMIHPNNHGTCWTLQAAVYADLTDNDEMLDFCANRFKTSILPLQMADDGSLPLELARTKPYGYSIFNLDAMSTLAQILSLNGYDLWNFRSPDGKSLDLGINFLFPYIVAKENWPYDEDVLYFDQYPVRQAFMVFGGLAYDKPEYIETWVTLESDPNHNEVVRNMIVKNPLLWMEINNSGSDKREVNERENASGVDLQLTLINPDALLYTRYLSSIGAEPYSVDAETLIANAKTLLDIPPFSVMNKEMMPPSGDMHDYYSLGPYWWPDPNTEDGLPYIRKDGIRNPERERYDRISLAGMTNNTFNLSLAWFYSGDQVFATKAAELLRTWFLNPDTKMNPHLEFGQSIPGKSQGRGIGIIETEDLIWVVESIGLLESSGALTDSELTGINQWFKDYSNWLITSKNGWDERMYFNNHGSAYDAQLASFAIFTGQDSLAEMILDSVKYKRIETQIMANGSQPYELARTKAMGYSCFNLIHLIHSAIMAEKYDIDLWTYENSRGASILTAFKYLIPFMNGEKEFPYEQLGGLEGQYEGFWQVLLHVSEKYDDELVQETVDNFPLEKVEAKYFRLFFPGVFGVPANK